MATMTAAITNRAIKTMARTFIGLLSFFITGRAPGGPTGVPHLAQNFAPSSNSAPHFEQYGIIITPILFQRLIYKNDFRRLLKARVNQLDMIALFADFIEVGVIEHT